MTLEQIRAREQAATAGPWHIQNDSECDYEAGIEYAEWPQTLIGPQQSHPSQWAKDHDETRNIDEINELTLPDAEFIAHARQDVPALLAAVDAVLAWCDTNQHPHHPSEGTEGAFSSQDWALDDAARRIRTAITRALDTK